jgi:hypothetical protein
MVVSRSKRRMESYCLMGTVSQLGKMEKCQRWMVVMVVQQWKYANAVEEPI